GISGDLPTGLTCICAARTDERVHSTRIRGPRVFAVELVALRRVASRSRRRAEAALWRAAQAGAAQRPSGAAHSVRSTRTGLSQRDKHHLQEIENFSSRQRRGRNPSTLNATVARLSARRSSRYATGHATRPL